MMSGKWHIGDEKPNWPINRGFDRFYGIPAGGGVYFWPPVGLDRKVYLNDQLVQPDSNWYSTDAFTDYAINFISEAARDEKPFFLYTAYIAPHFPLQAWPEDIKKYEDTYDIGHEQIRQKRFQRQKELNVLPARAMLSDAEYLTWSNFEDQSKEAKMMSVYAAMVDRLDQNVGRLINHLEAEGIADNTVIFFLSDNGGCPNGRNDTPNAQIGTRNSFVAYGRSWANVSNTPYRKYKAMTHEGGILTPLIAHWPNELTNKGLVTHEPAHIIDFMATCLEIAHAEYPVSFNHNQLLPPAGTSFLPQLKGLPADHERLLFWEHEGNKAVRQDHWKLVKRHKQEWELYDLSVNPTEIQNVVDQFPKKKAKLLKAYNQWAEDNQVLEWPVVRKTKF